MEITKEDAKNLSILLQRVDLKGNEATAVAILMQKLTALAGPQEKPKEETKKK
jgi:hypothetical protein